MSNEDGAAEARRFAADALRILAEQPNRRSGGQGEHAVWAHRRRRAAELARASGAREPDRGAMAAVRARSRDLNRPAAGTRS
jgi:hypothetical protein